MVDTLDDTIHSLKQEIEYLQQQIDAIERRLEVAEAAKATLPDSLVRQIAQAFSELKDEKKDGTERLFLLE